jgi:FKBP-type peptidyl-prolyl cis-trans isomerase SlyD
MTKALSKVVDKAAVTYRYTLTDATGEVLHRSPEAGETYLHGSGDLVEGLEKAMSKRKVGERFQVVVEPNKGYGPRPDGVSTLQLPRDRFPPGFPVAKGSSIELESPDGYSIKVWISGFDGDLVHLEDCHPFAGRTLHYDVEVLAAREATKEEWAHGHVHGPGSHH